MVKEPTDRLTGKEILSHPWVGAEVVRRNRTADAAGRAGSGDGSDGGRVNKVLHEQVVSVLESQAGITRTEIDEALEQRSYNYVASTYHLVAQQQIRRERGKKGRPASMAAGGGAGLSASFSLPEDGLVSPMGILHRASSVIRGDDCRIREPASSGKKQGTLRRRVRPLDTSDPLSRSMNGMLSPSPGAKGGGSSSPVWRSGIACAVAEAAAGWRGRCFQTDACVGPKLAWGWQQSSQCWAVVHLERRDA